MEKKYEAGGGSTHIKLAKKRSGIHNLKRKYDEMKAKFEKQGEELTEVKGTNKIMVACVVLHTRIICHI